jgi:hypothetical protein
VVAVDQEVKLELLAQVVIIRLLEAQAVVMEGEPEVL